MDTKETAEALLTPPEPDATGEHHRAFAEGQRKVISFDFKKAPMKIVRIRNLQVQSVRVTYKETDTTIEIEIWPRVNIDGDNGRPKGDLVGPGQLMELSDE